jgi:hypothetical protein
MVEGNAGLLGTFVRRSWRILGTIFSPSCWRPVSHLLLTWYLAAAGAAFEVSPADLSR